jgi:peptide/nickel transport system substrate-binding protein
LKRFIALIALPAILTLGLTGCSANSIIADSEISIAQLSAFDSFNADVLTSIDAQQVNDEISYLTTPSFYYSDASGELVANEAFGSVLVEDQGSGPLVTYKLNGSAKWSDGVALDETDLLLSWLAAADPTDAGFNSVRGTSGLQYAKPLDCSASNCDSLSFKYSQGVPDALTSIQVTVPAHLVVQQAFKNENYSAAQAKAIIFELALKPDAAKLKKIAKIYSESFSLATAGNDASLLVSAGPYVVKEVSPGEFLTLKANPNFTWGQKPVIETLRIKFFDGAAEMLGAIQEGQVDIAAPEESGILKNDDIASLISSMSAEGVKSFVQPSNFIEQIQLNFGERSVFANNGALRMAFLNLIPKAKIFQTIGASSGIRDVRSFVYPSSSGFYDPVIQSNGSDAFLIQDAEKAQELLLATDLELPVVIRVVFDTDNPRAQIEWSLLNEQALAVGFELVNLASDDPSVTLERGAFDVFIGEGSLIGVADGDPLGLIGNPITDFSNEKISELLSRYAAEQTAIEAADLLKQVDAELFASGYGLPLYQIPSIVVYSKNLANLVPAPFGHSATWGYWNWALSR